jgi:uncharacterized repeat protein (TIGR03803 family)
MITRSMRIVLLTLVCSNTLAAQTFTTLVSFDGTNGADSTASLVEGFDGNLYGTTGGGGSGCTSGCAGTVFKVTPTGDLTSLYSFCSEPNCADGDYPVSGLTVALDGNLYGVTTYGGANGIGGTFFRVTPSGELTTLHSFCALPNCADGEYPTGQVIQALDGNFYGTTSNGGANGYGSIFRATASGEVTTLYSFCVQANCADGEIPYAGLTQATDGNFYGTTDIGGAFDHGTIFRLTSEGVFTVLHSFCSENGCGDGAYPGDGALVQGDTGSLFGTTYNGGYGNGVAFGITLGGAFSAFRLFCPQLPDCASGGEPLFGVIQATDGNLYGTTTTGGKGGGDKGTVFRLTPPTGVVALHTFCIETGCPDGYFPGGLVQATNGTLYGATSQGGASEDGTIFSLSVGLAPFIQTLPTSRAVGTQVIILGNGLSGTTGISFNQVPATTFTIASDTQITATVPAGATTGSVTVTTPSGVLVSNKVFRVIP